MKCPKCGAVMWRDSRTVNWKCSETGEKIEKSEAINDDVPN